MTMETTTVIITGVDNRATATMAMAVDGAMEVDGAISLNITGFSA